MPNTSKPNQAKSWPTNADQRNSNNGKTPSQQLTAQGNQPHPQQAKAGGDGRGDINQLLALGLNRYPVV